MLSAVDEFLSDGRLFVSCQAGHGHPFRDSRMITALAACAKLGGASGLRLEGVGDIRAVRTAVALPIIGIIKVQRASGRPLITPSFADAALVAAAGADIVALDLTQEAHPHTRTVRAIISAVHEELDLPIVADVSTITEAGRAIDAGSDYVATTLSGYTPQSPMLSDGPDFVLLSEMVSAGMPAVLEGRIATPEDVRRARDIGAAALVVGAAITDPASITRRLSCADSTSAGRKVAEP